MIGICTDSNSQLPPELRDRWRVVVVPATVAIDGHEYLEGVNLDADEFYARFAAGHRPDVATAEPSPGQFALAYDELVARGCTEILSVHVGSALSSTLSSARLATRACEVPVRLVDTGTASFGVSCCVWAAGEALDAGASLEEAALLAEQVARHVRTVFTVGAIDLVRASGRTSEAFRAAYGDEATPIGVPVLTLRHGQVEVLREVDDVATAVAAMAAEVLRDDGPIHVGVGLADRVGAEISEALAARVTASGRVSGLVRYRIGPSVGVHTGPGAAGAFWFPAG